MKKKKEKLNSLEDLGGLIYSTEPAALDSINEEEDELGHPKNERLILRFETAHRGGKKVTIVSRFLGDEKSLISLSKELKKHCGTGGSIVDGEILIQGDNKEKMKVFLLKHGYKTNNI